MENTNIGRNYQIASNKFFYSSLSIIQEGRPIIAWDNSNEVLKSIEARSREDCVKNALNLHIETDDKSMLISSGSGRTWPHCSYATTFPCTNLTNLYLVVCVIRVPRLK